MKYDLYEHKTLVTFLNTLFKEEAYACMAPEVMRFFITTRNYGLDNYEEHLDRIISGEPVDAVIADVLEKGLGLTSNGQSMEEKKTFILEIMKNYSDYGYVFHSFPEAYRDSIERYGLSPTKRNFSEENFKKFLDILHKYEMDNSGYFKSAEKRLCILGLLQYDGTIGYAIQSPEWLAVFLTNTEKSFKYDVLWDGTYEEVLEVVAETLKQRKAEMAAVGGDSIEEDYQFLETFILQHVEDRFGKGNDNACVAFIPKKELYDQETPIYRSSQLDAFTYSREEAMFSDTYDDNLLAIVKDKTYEEIVRKYTNTSPFVIGEGVIREDIKDFYIVDVPVYKQRKCSVLDNYNYKRSKQ